MFAYLSSKEQKVATDIDDFANFQSRPEYTTDDFNNKFNDFYEKGKINNSEKKNTNSNPTLGSTRSNTI